MKPIFSRTLKALCCVMVVATLSACGASSTVSPFVPTRVIGLGDAYNDVGSSINGRYTVRGTNEIATVVEQLAAYFGVNTNVDAGIYVNAGTYTTLPSAGVFSYAVAGSLINSGSNSLQNQIDMVLSDVGGSFSDTDLILCK